MQTGRYRPYSCARNGCTSLKRSAITEYFDDRCQGDTNGKMFWQTIRPFLSTKGVLAKTRLLRAERDGLFELHLIVVCETVPWHRAADRGNYLRYLPACMNDMAALPQKQLKFYKCLAFDRYDSEISIKQLWAGTRPRCTDRETTPTYVQTTENIYWKRHQHISTGRVHM